jgi:hypothetical protein
MSTLVTLEEAMRHLRIDTVDSDGDDDLELKIFSASQSIVKYLQDGASPFIDSDGEIIVDSEGESVAPYPIKAACLILVGYLYKNRDENKDEAFDYGYLPKPVVALLAPYRTPVIA